MDKNLALGSVIEFGVTMKICNMEIEKVSIRFFGGFSKWPFDSRFTCSFRST